MYVSAPSSSTFQLVVSTHTSLCSPALLFIKGRSLIRQIPTTYLSSLLGIAPLTTFPLQLTQGYHLRHTDFQHNFLKVTENSPLCFCFVFFLNVGGHPKPLWDEAETKCSAGGLIPTHPLGQEARPVEGTTVGGVWWRKRTGLRWRGQGVVLPHVQRDVQPVLRAIRVFRHVSLYFCIQLLLLVVFPLLEIFKQLYVARVMCILYTDS